MFNGQLDEEKIASLSRSYSGADFLKVAARYAGKLGRTALFSAFCLYHAFAKGNAKQKAVIAAALVYLGMPLDVIPDFIPVVGLADDIAVLAWAAATVGMLIDDDVRQKASDSVDALIGPEKK